MYGRAIVQLLLLPFDIIDILLCYAIQHNQLAPVNANTVLHVQNINLILAPLYCRYILRIYMSVNVYAHSGELLCKKISTSSIIVPASFYVVIPELVWADVAIRDCPHLFYNMPADATVIRPKVTCQNIDT